MNSTRRDIVMLAGGSAVGVLFTPAPWRLVTDSALWSENWPGIPAPARGEIRTRYTNCSLCTAGCGVRARCVGDQPVQLAGVAGHPLSRGVLCPFGLAGHHLPYNPGRVKEGSVQQAETAVAAAIAKLAPGEHVATLDLRAGRTMSWTHRRAMAAVKNGLYIGPGAAWNSLAVDLAKVRTVVSIGVPLLDGWGTPGNVIAARSNFRLIQADPIESRTASMADRWLRIRPGSEQTLVQALHDGLPVSASAEATGLSAAQIESLARELNENAPYLVIAADGVYGTGRSVLARREAPAPSNWKPAPVTDLTAVPDRSVRVLMVDESAGGEYIPWSAIQNKLVPEDPVVVAFSPSHEGYARHAHFVLAVGVYPEVADDIPTPLDSVSATFRIAAPLVKPPASVVRPDEFIAKAVGISLGDPLRERADAIHKSGRGSLFTYADAKSAAVKDISADDFWKALNSGACWMDDVDEKAAVAQLAPARATVTVDEQPDLPLVVVLSSEIAPASPLLSKLYQESNLRLGQTRVALNPACGIGDGAKATLQTVLGKSEVTVSLDPGVPRGVVQVAASPAVCDMCSAGARANVVRS